MKTKIDGFKNFDEKIFCSRKLKKLALFALLTTLSACKRDQVGSETLSGPSVDITKFAFLIAEKLGADQCGSAFIISKKPYWGGRV